MPHNNRQRDADDRQIYRNGCTVAEDISYLCRTGTEIRHFERASELHSTILCLEEFSRSVRDSYADDSVAWHSYDCTVQALEALVSTTVREITHLERRLRNLFIRRLRDILDDQLRRHS